VLLPPFAAAVVVIVVTGGTAAPLLALVAAGALAGAGLAIIIASAVYKGLSVGDYIVIAFAGAIVGASIGLAVGILTGAAGAAALPAFVNASSALGAAAGGVSSETLAFVNSASPGKFLELVVIGTIIGGLTGEAFGTPKTASVDTLDLTSVFTALGVDVPKNALIIYASAVNGYFTTAHLTGTDTHVPDWLGTLFTLSGIVIPGVAAGINAANAAPAAGNAASGLAPATP